MQYATRGASMLGTGALLIPSLVMPKEID
jgi:hypothetical protein